MQRKGLLLKKKTSADKTMGCRQSTVIPVASVETFHKSPEAFKKEEVEAMRILKTTTEEDKDTEMEKQTEMKVLQQLRENDTLRKSYISTGGVAYNIGLRNDDDYMLVTPACPKRITRRLEKPNISYSKEKEPMADILTKHELTSKGDTARIITGKQEKAKQRREERQREISEKFERKRKLAEERLRKLEEKRKEKLDKMTEAILLNERPTGP